MGSQSPRGDRVFNIPMDSVLQNSPRGRVNEKVVHSGRNATSNRRHGSITTDSKHKENSVKDP